MTGYPPPDAPTRTPAVACNPHLPAAAASRPLPRSRRRVQGSRWSPSTGAFGPDGLPRRPALSCAWWEAIEATGTEATADLNSRRNRTTVRDGLLWRRRGDDGFWVRVWRLGFEAQRHLRRQPLQRHLQATSHIFTLLRVKIGTRAPRAAATVPPETPTRAPARRAAYTPRLRRNLPHYLSALWTARHAEPRRSGGRGSTLRP